MKKHWKKFLLSILGIYLAYGIITLVPAYMDNKEWKKREETAIEIMNVINDPFLSSKEKDSKLQELHGISSDGVGSNGMFKYEISDKSTTKEYRELIDVLEKNNFTIQSSTSDELIGTSENNDMFIYRNYGDIKEANFHLEYDDIKKVKVSKNKTLKDILKVLGIKNLNIDNKIKKMEIDDEINLSLENGWTLSVDITDYDTLYESVAHFFEDSDDNNDSTSSGSVNLNFSKYYD